jgi:putative NADH-flavin reductase
MKLAVIGPTGFVGKILVEKALKTGYQVRALVRSPEKLGELQSKLEIVHGDMFDSTSLQKLITGVDAVILLVGPTAAAAGRDWNRLANAMRLIVDAMKAANVSRIIYVAGLVAKLPGQPLGFKQSLIRRFVLNLMMPEVLKAGDSAVKILAASGLLWTIIRSPLMTTGKPTGKVTARTDDMLLRKLDVEDIADFMLSALQTNEWDCKAPIVAST